MSERSKPKRFERLREMWSERKGRQLGAEVVVAVERESVVVQATVAEGAPSADTDSPDASFSPTDHHGESGQGDSCGDGTAAATLGTPEEELPTTREYFPDYINDLIDEGMPVPVFYGGPPKARALRKRASSRTRPADQRSRH